MKSTAVGAQMKSGGRRMDGDGGAGWEAVM